MVPRGAYFATPAFANTISSLPFSCLICAKRRSRSPAFDTSPCTPVTFLSELLYRRSQFRFTATADEDVRAFVHKLLRRRQTDAAVATSDDCNFSFKPIHVFLLGCLFSLFFGVLVHFQRPVSSYVGWRGTTRLPTVT